MRTQSKNVSGSLGGKYHLMRQAAVTLVVGLIVIGLSFHAPRVVRADTQLAQRPRGVRAAHLISDPVPGRVDYIFRQKNSGSPSTITAYAPGGTFLCAIAPDPSQPIQDLVDVVDLDGDGNAEIIGSYSGNGSTDFPALWIYNGNCTLRAKWNTPAATTLGPQQVKIYDVLPANGQKRIVFVPNTFPNYVGPASVYFIDAWGNQVAQNIVPPNSAGTETLTFPGIAVGNIDNSGGNEIIVIAKSRLMAFNQNGQKLYYRQFVDPAANFINYDTGKDIPVGSTNTLSGRRYGLFAFADVNGDGDLELILAADANNIIGNIPGAVYEAYDLSASAQNDNTHIRYIWQRWLPRADSNYMVTNNNPAGYPIGVPLDGIADVNADGIPEIMVTESDAMTGNPVIKAINGATGGLTGTLINGILLGLRRLDGSQSLVDLIVYDNTVFNPLTGMGNIKVFRLNAGTYTPFQLSQSPSGNLSNFAAQIVGGNISDQISLSDPFYLPVGITSNQGHFSPLIVRANNVKTFVAYTALGCPSGLYSWKTTGGVVQPSLTIFPRPGELVSALPTTDNKNHVWILNLENSCASTNIVRTAIQSGPTLVPNGDL
ncbi:MAG TPA: hypothetical protein VGD61_24065 [Pyrinomonadaceae bacterium]